MKKRIFTIGYAHVFGNEAFPLPFFLEQLKKHNIVCLIDVRSYPKASDFYGNYSKDKLEKYLNAQNIFYRNYSYFGARQENRKYWNEMDAYDKKNGNKKKKTNYCLDFEKFTHGKEFKEGIETLNKIFPYFNQKGNANAGVVLMCAEKDPIMCHRTIMIAHALDDLNDDFEIQHIVWNENAQCFELESQKEIDQRLLKHYKKDAQDFFNQNQSEKERIQEAYHCANSAIGYSGLKNESGES